MQPGHGGRNLRQVVIVGGGTAGWMTAALLSQISRGKLFDITLVESDAIGTIGVGEATIPAIRRFNRLLEVHERDFIINTQATFKLGIEFVNWGRLGSSYIHPFGNIGTPIGRTGFEHYFTRRRLEGRTDNFETYSLNATAARHDRFAIPPRDGSLLSELAYAYHFDAGLYAAYLRRYAEARGVRRIEGKIAHVAQNPETGHVTTLKLENGQSVAGEFFIDCSGLAGLLIEKTLNSGYEDWSAYLPCDRAAFIPSESAESISPYTRSIAHTAGWQWRIPLQHRIGNGHVFSSAYIEDGEAGDVLLRTLDQKPLAEPKFLRFQTGRRKLSWNRNVVAIGLSSGFLEPLESTSIHLIHSGLVKLLDFWPDRTFNPLLIAQYNRAMANQYESIRDFIILHYKATDREDSEFWRYCKHMSVPDSLAYKMDHFRSSSRIVLSPGELFQPASWFSVMVGQNVLPTGYDSLADLHEPEDVEQKLASLQRAVAHTVDAMPTHRQVLAGLR